MALSEEAYKLINVNTALILFLQTGAESFLKEESLVFSQFVDCIPSETNM